MLKKKTRKRAEWSHSISGLLKQFFHFLFVYYVICARWKSRKKLFEENIDEGIMWIHDI